VRSTCRTTASGSSRQTRCRQGAEIVVYCASPICQNSHIAARSFEQLGYTNVGVYAGGKQDWQDAGLRGDSTDFM
jgi:rhodanese-related sulfurtransferase